MLAKIHDEITAIESHHRPVVTGLYWAHPQFCVNCDCMLLLCMTVQLAAIQAVPLSLNES